MKYQYISYKINEVDIILDLYFIKLVSIKNTNIMYVEMHLPHHVFIFHLPD